MTIAYTEEAKIPLLDSGGSNWGAVFNGAMAMVDRGLELTILAGEAISAYDLVYPYLNAYLITDVDIATETFTIDGSHSDKFIVGNKFSIKSSTGNDGIYTVESVTEIAGPETEIIVEEDVTDATVDGRILVTEAFKAKADSKLTAPAIGMAIADIISGMNGKIRIIGWIENEDWNFSMGEVVYLSDSVAGGIVGSCPSVVRQRIGMAKSPSRLLLNIEPPMLEIVCNDNEVVCNNNEIVYV